MIRNITMDNSNQTPEEKFSRILEVFLVGHLPKDDTMIEKLDNWFQTSLTKDETLVQKAKIPECLSRLTQQAQTPQDPQMVAFFLKLLSHVQWSMTTEHTRGLWELYGGVTQSDVWMKPVLRCAWLTGLDNLIAQPGATEDVAHWLLTEGHISKIFACLTDNSIFVCKAAIELSAKLLSNLEQLLQNSSNQSQPAEKDVSAENAPPERPRCYETHKQITSNFWSYFKNSETTDPAVGLASLQIVHKVLESGPKSLTEAMYSKHRLVDQVCSVLSPPEGSVSDSERNVCLDILKCCVNFMSREDVQKLAELAESLVDGDIKTAIILAHSLLMCPGMEVKGQSSLEDIRFVVLTVAASEINQSARQPQSLLVQRAKTCIHRKVKSFPSLFMKQLSIMRQSHDVKNVPLSTVRVLREVFEYVFGESPKSPMLDTLARSDKISHDLLDTFTYIFSNERDERRKYKYLMVSFTLICAGLLMRHKPCLLVQKALKCVLVCLSYLLQDFDKKKDAYVQQLTQRRGSQDHPESGQAGDSLDDDDSLVEEVIGVWASVVVGVNRLLCDPQWELVDSVTEFLSDVLRQIGDACLVQRAFIVPHLGGFADSILKNLEHTESYLRSSSLLCVSAMAKNPAIWDQLVQSHPKEDILEKVVTIAAKDSEAFARRSAIKAVGVFHGIECYSSMTSDILKVMSSALNDLDWEVKLNVLEFWENFINISKTKSTEPSKKDVPDYASCLTATPTYQSEGLNGVDKPGPSLCDDLVDSGCLRSLLQLAHDCDKQVQKKACLLLVDIMGEFPEDPSRKVRRTEQTTTSGDCPTKQDMLLELQGLDVDALLALASLSTDQYDLNPTALLDDILTSVSKQDDKEATEGGDSVLLIDCY